MLAWIHRNLPIVLASILSALVHTVVLFPLIEVIGSGRFNSDRAEDTLGRELPGLTGPERDRETDRREHRERQVVRKLSIRRIQEEVRQRDPDEERPREPEPAEPEPSEIKVELGIDESDAVTMNWIGFSEYEKHLAALAEVEQAALRLESSSGSLGSAPPTLAPTAPTESVAMSPNPGPEPAPANPEGSMQEPETALATPPTETPTTQAPATAASSAPEGDGIEPEPEPATREEPTPEPVATEPEPATAPAPSVPELLARDPADAERTGPAATEAAPPLPPELPERNAASPSGADLLREPREGADPDVVSPLPPGERIDESRDPSPSQERSDSTGTAPEPSKQAGGDAAAGGVAGPQVLPGTANTPSTPAPAGSPGDARSEQGRLSTRESDPTSTIDVPQSVWQFGAPLARKGIRLDTVRPRFTTLNLIDGIRFNPIVELVIGRDGVPQHVVISRSTGNLGANEELRSTLYKWRASGKQLEQLKPGQTITIRLRLVMLQD